MKNLVDLLNESINESKGVVYAVLGGNEGGHRFDEIYMFTSTHNKAMRVAREEMDNEKFKYTFVEEVPCDVNLNRFVAAVVGYSKKEKGYVKVISVHNKEKDANEFIKNMSEEDKALYKKQHDVDSYEVELTIFEK